MVSVRDLLKLPALAGITVVAGTEGLENQVEHVTVMEVPDIRQWLKGNDFLITSFYSVRQSEEEQCELIDSLADTCCCVAVKTGQYVKSISERVREKADQHGLPLLQIPYEMTYIDIIVAVMNQILEEKGETEILEKYVRDIIYENYSDEFSMSEKGRLLGLEVKRDYFAAITIAFRKDKASSYRDDKKLGFWSRSLEERIRRRDVVNRCFQMRMDRGFIILAEASEKEPLEETLDSIINESYLKNLWKMESDLLACSMGPARKGMVGIRDTYLLSSRSLRIGELLFAGRSVYSYQEMQEFCALEDMLSKTDGKIFSSL